ncbi:alkylation response protein AidB-like acyl-CoA dehydrogenase [Crossiella equi]|uniref:Alkylation response protein AidB-like acyl-CoA dehydrogenase n=1 Tax=Crossiella equi TaxID=130796 RepID=A0ABS5ANF7_9PSEU|nr:alkylation response protein AidB-like acyl-CoA dehydrogenase [Crossiella equi]
MASVIGVEVFELEVLVCAAQLLGAARAMVELAVAHAATRRQFGRAVGEFQAVQHRLADVHVALEMARPLVFAAALSLAPRDTSAARVAAADVAQRAVSASLQVHGALGYTQEYSLGRFILLARRLRGRFGSQDFHRGRVLAALEGAWTWE